MRTCLLLFLSCLAIAANAQFNPYYQTNFIPLQSRPCLTGTVDQPLGWSLYQTLDGAFDGPIDSSICINCTIDGWCKVDLSQVDPSRSLFLRNDPSIFTELLLPDWLYNFTFNASIDDCSVIQTGIGCTQNICSGAFLGISIPDSMGVPFSATRTHHAIATTFQSPPDYCALNIQACFPTEKFELQRMRDAAIKIQFTPGVDLSNKSLFIYDLLIDPLFDPISVCLVEDIPVPATWFVNETANLNIRDVCSGGWGDNVLLGYKDDTYPSPQHISLVEAYPSPNAQTPHTINIWVDPYQVIEFQPFTQLIGGLVEGEDSIRHQVNLINDGGDFCFNFFEVVMAEKQEYWHKSGALSFNSPQSCMRFEAGSALRVLDRAQLHYGHDGVGMLAMCSGAEISIEPGAGLFFDGVLILSDCGRPAQPVKVTLPHGARMAFSENARFLSHNDDVLLEIMMNGGKLDLEQLSATDRAHVRVIYPTPSETLSENIRIFPNPVGEWAQIQYLSAGDENVRVIWQSIDGKPLSEQTCAVQKGYNDLLIPVPPSIPSGVYGLVIQTSSGQIVKKVSVF